MTRQASGGEPRSSAEGWQGMAGGYAASEGCENQAIALAILQRCGGAPLAPERERPGPRIAERDPR